MRHLRSTREATGLNQREVAEKLQESINYVSRRERGERRMDLIELMDYCAAIGKSPSEFVRELEELVKS